MINKAILIGNVGEDPEARNLTNGGVVTNFTLATSIKIKGEERTEWHRITVWGQTAEFARDYVKKGSKLYIEGEIKTRKWQDKDGNDRYRTEINVGNFNSNLKILTPKGETESGATGGNVETASEDPNDEIPFDL
jgi:single-strand DNA-binding protein